MYWEAVYSDRSVFTSNDYNWKDLPSENFIRLTIFLPAGGKMNVNGWDFYVLEEFLGGVKVSYWKDTVANDINGNPIPEPYLDKGATRSFYNDGTATGIEYHPASVIKKGIPKNMIKAGIWVPDDLARELKVL